MLETLSADQALEWTVFCCKTVGLFVVCYGWAKTVFT